MIFRGTYTETVEMTYEMEINAHDEDMARKIFQMIVDNSEPRSHYFRTGCVKEKNVIAQNLNVEYVSGDTVPEGTFEWHGHLFRPARKMVSSDWDDLDDKLDFEQCIASCDNWDDLYDFWEAYGGLGPDRMKTDLFECVDNGLLYFPDQYGLVRWTGAYDAERDYRDVCGDLVWEHDLSIGDDPDHEIYNILSTCITFGYDVEVMLSGDCGSRTWTHTLDESYDYVKCRDLLIEDIKEFCSEYDLDLLAEDAHRVELSVQKIERTTC